MRTENVERDKILKLLEEDYSDGNWESLIDKVEKLMTDSFSDGYSFAKKEKELVEAAASAMSD